VTVAWHSDKMVDSNVAVGTGAIFWYKLCASFLFHNVSYDSKRDFVASTWAIGELVQGPVISKYKVACTFMWPLKLMPDPRAVRRLLPFDCEVNYKKQKIKIPIRITDPSDYQPGTKKARIIEKPVWLVEIVMPKALMSEIRTGSIEMEDQDIDLEELDSAYEEDLDKEEYQNDEQAQDAQQQLTQPTQTPAV